MKLPVVRSKCRPGRDTKSPSQEIKLPSGNLSDDLDTASNKIIDRLKPSFIDIDIETPWGKGGVHI